MNFYSNSEEIRKSFREKGTVIKDLIDLMPSVPLVNPMYSHSENLQYQDVSKKWGIDQTGFSTGSAYGDLDNDGDLDLYVMNHSSQDYAGLGKISKHHKKQKNQFISYFRHKK